MKYLVARDKGVTRAPLLYVDTALDSLKDILS